MHLHFLPFTFPTYLINSPTFPPIPIIFLAIYFPHLPHLPPFFSFCLSFFCFSEYYSPFKVQNNNFCYNLFSLFYHIYSPISFTLHLSSLSVLPLILFSLPWPELTCSTTHRCQHHSLLHSMAKSSLSLSFYLFKPKK